MSVRLRMQVTIGSDHRGLEQRKVIAAAIEALEFKVDDQGSFTEESCDYPDIATKVARQIVSGDSDLGILVCGTGIGMSIAANKINGIRAALCLTMSDAVLSRQHNNANILCLSGNNFDPKSFTEIVTGWLQAEFEGGRHARRVEKVMKLESE